jgi:hypothetical protein
MPRYLNVYDESFMLTGALRINAGELPYRDFYAIYGPAEYYALAGLFKLFGPSVLAELGFLYCSLIVMCGCLLSVLASYQLSIHVQYKVADYWAKRKDKMCTPEFPMRGADAVRALNILDGILFTIGISLAVLFVVVNIHISAKELSQMMKLGHANDGAPIRVPSDVVEKGQNVKMP